MHTCTHAHTNTCKGIDFPQVFFWLNPAPRGCSQILCNSVFAAPDPRRSNHVPGSLLAQPGTPPVPRKNGVEGAIESKGFHAWLLFLPPRCSSKAVLRWASGSGKGDSPTRNRRGPTGFLLLGHEGEGLTVHRGIFRPRSSTWRVGSGICPPGETLERGRRGQAGGTPRWWDRRLAGGLPRPTSRSQPQPEMKREDFSGILALGPTLAELGKNQTNGLANREELSFFLKKIIITNLLALTR